MITDKGKMLCYATKDECNTNISSDKNNALPVVVQNRRRQPYLVIMENILNALPARNTIFLPLKLHQASALKSAQTIKSQMPQPFLAYRS